MKLNLNCTKDCINCARAEVYGDSISPNVTCTSSDSLHYKLFDKDGRFCAAYCKGYKERDAKEECILRKGSIDLKIALKFMLAGKSEFVMHSNKTNQDFTYRLNRKISQEDKDKFIYFVSTKMGTTWEYAGILWYDDKQDQYRFAQGKKGQVDASNIYIRSLIFVLNKLHKGGIPEHLTVYHTGSCGRCGKKLTTTESILTGLGPECSKKVGIPRVKITKNMDLTE